MPAGTSATFVRNFNTPIAVEGGASVTGILTGSKTHDFASIANGASTNTTVTVTGAALGDFAVASLNVSGGVVAGAGLVASVTAADTVTVTLLNQSGGAVDLASGTLRVLVLKITA